tara:strand:+ start:115 stop:384 length:270 start_codon:yes stop_codon:yes gene_type:complete
MNFYQTFEKVLENHGHSISARYDYNDETFKDEPDLNKMELGVYVDTKEGNAYDISWDNDIKLYTATVIEGNDIEDESGNSVEELCKYLQ